jgi:hypothetical protein
MNMTQAGESRRHAHDLGHVEGLLRVVAVAAALACPRKQVLVPSVDTRQA